VATRLNHPDSRPVVRETADVDPSYGRRLMVRLEPGGKLITLWQKGRRLRLKVTYADVWRLALAGHVRAKIAEKKAAKIARKKGAKS
jgi:hypothetical protein